MRLPWRFRRSLLPGVCALVLLAACSEKPTLTIDEKTRFVAELIAARSQCSVHAQRLAVPARDEAALREMYEAAKAAHCLKSNV